MDNCARENKNRYVFTYLSYLIKCKIFNKIEISFLPVGHTHEDIDQLFSRISTYIEYRDIITMNDMFEHIHNSCIYKPDVTEITEIADMKTIMIANKWIHEFQGINNII